MKILSIHDLQIIRKRAEHHLSLREESNEKVSEKCCGLASGTAHLQILICGGTGCKASSSQGITENLQKAIERNKDRRYTQQPHDGRGFLPIFPGEKIYDPVATEKHTNVSQQHSFRHQEHHLIHETDITFSGNLRENSLRHHGDGELHQMQYLIRHIIDGDLRHPQEGPDHQLVYIHVNLCDKLDTNNGKLS